MEQPNQVQIRRVQVRDYRCLRHVDVRLDGNFYVLVGPNGSGKSTLFDAIKFVFDLFNGGLKAAIDARTQNFQDLVWERPKESLGFELAAEFDVMDQKFRYEVKVEETSGRGVGIVQEAGYFGVLSDEEFTNLASSDTIFSNVTQENLRPVFRRYGQPRTGGYPTTFCSERDGGTHTLHVPGDTSSVRYVELVNQVTAPNDSDIWDRHFSLPVATATTARLTERRTVQSLQLDSRALRKPSVRNGDDGSRLAEDGSNLPRVVSNLSRDKSRWSDWLDHVRTVLPTITGIRSVTREEERSDYLMIRYANGVEVPAWGVSEGTLRLLALTISAYLPDAQPAAYLIEEPENGIHPMAIEMSYQSLSSLYRSQVFVASHSPTFLRCVEPHEVLCFSKDEVGGTTIMRGDEHPNLSEWRGSIDDDLFFAPDILG